MRSFVAAAGLLLVSAGAVLAQSNAPPAENAMKAAPILSGAAVKWGPAPAVLPAGAQLAVLSGDPSKAEPFTIRLRLPEGYRIAPHYHPTDEGVTVLRGTFIAGMGDVASKDGVSSFTAGGYALMPANVHHYAWTKGLTEIQIHGTGPFQLTYVNPADDPSQKK